MAFANTQILLNIAKAQLRVAAEQPGITFYELLKEIKVLEARLEAETVAKNTTNTKQPENTMNATTQTTKVRTFVIRKALDCEMVNCFEGEDGKQRAEELVGTHNTIYPNARWFVSEELL